MTTKRNQKNEKQRNLKIFYETKWSKQLVTAYNQAQKMLKSTSDGGFYLVRSSCMVTKKKANRSQLKILFFFSI